MRRVSFLPQLCDLTRQQSTRCRCHRGSSFLIPAEKWALIEAAERGIRSFSSD